LMMLHGWMDVSATFQFVVDELAADFRVLAPDWRGYGLTERGGADCYWFADYLGDLDALLREISPAAPVNLLGHSMGGNVAMLYGGVRPERVASLINLEGFGLKSAPPGDAPGRYSRWLDEIHEGGRLRTYRSLDDVAQRLRGDNPRLSLAQAAFLAQHGARRDDDGVFHIAGDLAHKIVNPVLYRWEEVAACWARIAAPVLWVQAADTHAHAWAGEQSEIDARRAVVPDLEAALIDDAGHKLHHDQPAAVARLIEGFLARRL
ncbi:MAG: alpha/beta hydrolase, partial [Burkholderiaceae bacterium]